ncbi:hypothetical protein HX833_04375 [Marine Group I thaumarchaeote]|jgi:hypothetical protein|uniref:Uncharacterized protein n=1 Tax=Marine Group I thaumarchaeote TaxID=2511932 RepID=A0A7K4NSJ6_9ARCH|nr:hypothetical protein [Marine Group I thaumarchaeote]
MYKNSVPFRAWYYFRMGWSTYFAFILAAINTLTVTYFLAIDNYPSLKSVFPSFEVYILIIVSVGIPVLIAIGYAHFKRTQAFKSEIDVMIESNPYQRRNTVNNEINLRMNLQLMKLLTKLVNNEKLDTSESENLKKLIKTYEEFTENRSFVNNSDIDFIKEEIQKK